MSLDFFNLDTYDYYLPEQLIAKYPAEKRSQSRLLAINKENGDLKDLHFYDLPSLLEPGDLLVFNNTKVIPARLYGQKESGGKVECLLDRMLSEHTVLAHLRASKSPKPGGFLQFGDCRVEVLSRQEDLFELKFDENKTVLQWLDILGEMPLPPYFNREVEELDKERYQTVYAKHDGAVAAPTAGLHFDEQVLSALKEKGVEFAYVLLHVGAGTFQPVRTDDIREHHMHSEYMELNQKTADQINACKARGNRVIAVGTTSVRCLETAANEVQASRRSDVQTFQGDTEIFIYPGYEYKIVDGLITNFHLPKSTLMMLVTAFGGYEHMMHAYRHAVESKYRFYSYGDSMLISEW